MDIKIDDILAALILSLAMFRRLETKTAANPGIPEAPFAQWQQAALRAYTVMSIASAAKVVLSVGWFWAAMALEVGTPWLQIGGLLVFLGWVITAVWAWKLATDARYLRVSLGIVLRRRAAQPRAVGE